MTPRTKLLDGPHGQRWLTIGLCLVALILIVQGAINGAVVLQAEKRALATYRESMASIEFLTAIDHDIGIERALVDDHIFEHEAVNMREIELQLAAIDRDIQHNGELYAREIDQPQEAELWHHVQELWGRFEFGKATALAYSRQLDDERAHAAMLDVLDEYHELQQSLAELHLINQQGTDDTVAEIATLQNQAQDMMWVLRVVALIMILLLGLWGRRRIATYEKRILDDARMLEERNHDLDAFAGRVAHDLKNVLAPLAMLPEALRRAQRDPPRVLESANRAERSIRRAVGILDALLAFSRASGNVPADESAALEPVLKSVLDELAPQIAQVDASVEVEPLPDVALRCDPGLLHIVLANLCGNAIKFLAGRAQRCVRISAHVEDGTCRIDVTDTGPGIPQPARARIFEPFYRVEGTQAPGSGIGLATVRRVVESREGRVAVESEAGRGSCFRLWLPRAATPQGAQAARADASRPAADH